MDMISHFVLVRNVQCVVMCKMSVELKLLVCNFEDLPIPL